jgi:hypothetical protein
VTSVIALARHAAAPGDRLAAWLLASPAAAYYLFFGALGDWAGGRAYGPRYLVPILPLFAIAVAPAYQRASLRSRRLISAVVVVSALMQLPGVMVDYSRVSQAWAAQADAEALASRLHRWSSSPWFLNAREAAAAVPRNVRYLTGAIERPRLDTTADAGRRDFAQQFAFSLDFWWLYLVYLDILTPTTAVSLALAIGVTTVWLAARAWSLGRVFDAAPTDDTPAPIRI